MKTIDIETHLAEELEGKLFEHIYVLKVFDVYWACTDYYTAAKGKVFLINDGTMQNCGDTLETLKNDCYCIGQYDASVIHKQKRREYTHDQILKLLQL